MRSLLYFFALCMLFVSCDKQHEVGKYVYIDYFDVIHIDKDCDPKLSVEHDKKIETQYKVGGMQFVDTCEVQPNIDIYGVRQFKYCPRCVDDKAYEHLERIMRRNLDAKKEK